MKFGVLIQTRLFRMGRLQLKSAGIDIRVFGEHKVSE
jgi:hypothetical protein